MEIKLRPGRYVAAVSGGVDSMAMLEMLRRRPGVELIIAHLDHGIRPDSAEDRQLVQAYAEQHGLPFIYEEARLGPNASEDEARQARYGFLRRIREKENARAIITGHHKDDVLETAVHNLLRGTGRKGLSSLADTPDTARPLLHLTKADLRAYAQAQGIKWREDSTNLSTAYTRNYIRRVILPKLTEDQKRKLADHIQKAGDTNLEIDTILSRQMEADRLDRRWFISLPHAVAREVMAGWLRANGIRSFDRKLLELLVARAKTLKPGKRVSVTKDCDMNISTDELILGVNNPHSV